MQLSGSDFYRAYRPSECDMRLYLHHKGGDPNGIAAAVLANLFDLLPATQDSVMLPLPSYSLKVVEEYVGFERTQDEYGGAWSMAQYIEATETDDEATRQKLMNDILKYNEVDLAATWAVLSWVRKFGRGIASDAD